MDTCGLLPLFLLKNLLPQPPSWPTRLKTNDSPSRSGECFWASLIDVTWWRIQFHLVLKATWIWIICLVLNCDTCFIAIQRSCSVGVPDARKAATMDSLRNFTSTCGRLSFRDVVATGVGGCDFGDITDGGMQGRQILQVLQPNLQPQKESSSYEVRGSSAWPTATTMKENMLCASRDILRKRNDTRKSELETQATPTAVASTTVDGNSPQPAETSRARVAGFGITCTYEVSGHVSSVEPSVLADRAGMLARNMESPPSDMEPTKPKRKYNKKQKSPSINNRNHDVPTTSAPRQKRKYIRKSMPTIETPPIVARSTLHEGDSPQLAGISRGRTIAQDRGQHRKGYAGRVDSEDFGDPILPNSRAFSPPVLRARLNQPRQVRVLLRDLVWGGEFLPVRCPTAIGTVLLWEEAPDGADLVQVDFGSYFGVQTLPCAVCEEIQTPSLIPSEGVMDSSGEASLVLDNVEFVGPVGWELANSDSDHDWDPALSDLGSEYVDGLSSGDSSVDAQEDDPLTLLGELGVYPLGAESERPDLDLKYSDANWHARSWSLLPRQAFNGNTPGASDELPKDTLLQPIEYFLLFWDEVLQRKIVRESNEYANYIDPTTGKRKGGEVTALPITMEEFRQFTGICCLMGVRNQPCIRDYWRRGHGTLLCANVACTMSRWRFEYILRCLHMTSRSNFVTNKQSPQYNPIGKCRWILEHVESQFQKYWNLSPFVTVDECMVAYNGRFCSFKQYLPAKPITHGIKIWTMACSVTSYVYRLEIYVGKGNTQLDHGPSGAQIGMAGQVVSRLTRGLEGKWYTVTCDNFFTSPYLFDDLLARGFYAVGTVRKQRKGFPTSLGITHDQPRGTLHIRVHKDRKMAAILWQDTKGVNFLATTANPMVPGGILTCHVSGQRIAEVPTSPIQVLYSQKMGGVDVADQNRSYYSTQIATKKWWHRVFFFCLDSSLANAFTIHKETAKTLGERVLTHKEFQLRVAYSLMGRPYKVERTTMTVRRVLERPCERGICHIAHKTTLRRVCCVCKRRTFYICQECEGVRLCTIECFKFFHTRRTRA